MIVGEIRKSAVAVTGDIPRTHNQCGQFQLPGGLRDQLLADPLAENVAIVHRRSVGKNILGDEINVRRQTCSQSRDVTEPLAATGERQTKKFLRPQHVGGAQCGVAMQVVDDGPQWRIASTSAAAVPTSNRSDSDVATPDLLPNLDLLKVQFDSSRPRSVLQERSPSGDILTEKKGINAADTRSELGLRQPQKSAGTCQQNLVDSPQFGLRSDRVKIA